MEKYTTIYAVGRLAQQDKVDMFWGAAMSRIELGNLHVRRDYSDVRNIATAYRKLVECPEAKGAINVCSGNAYMVSEISGHTLEVAVNPDFVRAGEVELLYGSREKLEKTVGPIEWIPLRDTLRWMPGT
jgi:nucleoside-diphosphate-sugar epimerase